MAAPKSVGLLVTQGVKLTDEQLHSVLELNFNEATRQEVLNHAGHLKAKDKDGNYLVHKVSHAILSKLQ